MNTKIIFLLSLVCVLATTTITAGTHLLNWSGDQCAIVLEGELTGKNNRSTLPESLPISAIYSDGTVYIEFTEAVGDVEITLLKEGKIVSTRSTSVQEAAAQIRIPLSEILSGTYVLEFKNAAGGYVSGQFVLQ